MPVLSVNNIPKKRDAIIFLVVFTLFNFNFLTLLAFQYRPVFLWSLDSTFKYYIILAKNIIFSKTCICSNCSTSDQIIFDDATKLLNTTKYRSDYKTGRRRTKCSGYISKRLRSSDSYKLLSDLFSDHHTILMSCYFLYYQGYFIFQGYFVSVFPDIIIPDYNRYSEN